MIQHLPSNKILAHSIEWMKTPVERSRGLLKYASAPQNFAAIFKLPFGGLLPLVHTIGMKFSIDIIFCDLEGRVKYKKLGVPAGRFVLPIQNIFGGCAYLVEFSGCDLSSVNVGDVLKWEAA